MQNLYEHNNINYSFDYPFWRHNRYGLVAAAFVEEDGTGLVSPKLEPGRNENE